MGDLRRWIRRLEKRSRGELVGIRQVGGEIKRFPPKDLSAAFLATTQALGGEGRVIHPLSDAADGSSDELWRGSFYSTPERAGGGNLEDVPDLSE
jgi:hypothetical protein